MKKNVIEKQLKKTIAKKESLKKSSKQLKALSKSFEKELKKLLKNKKTKKELQAIEKASNERKIKKAKEKLLNEKHLKEGKTLERKNRLENFSGLYESKENNFNQYCFSSKDFYIHGIDLKENENEKKLLHIYNKIESIGKGMNLNDIEKIILENLKKRFILEFCNNFKSNLKKKNAKDIKTLNSFFINSNLKKYIANAKEKESLNIFENENANIFGKSSNNFESKYIEKINGKYILHQIGKIEKEKAKESLQAKKNGKKLNGKERKTILKEKNKLEKAKKILKEKESLKSLYNLKSKQIENAINQNSFLIKTGKQIERIKRKALEKNGIDLKEKQLKESLKDFELKERLTKKELKAIEKTKENLQAIKEKKKALELKIYGYYKNRLENIVNHGKQAKEKELKAHLEKVKNCNGKLAYLQKYFENEYGKRYLKDFKN